jgi:MFS family permease
MSDPARVVPQQDVPRQRAVRFIVLIGVVSLFSDMTYESARSINGPFLATLGASATLVGVVAGSGVYADRSQRYWTVTIWGYVLNLLAVPLLALAGSWQIASVLIVLERMGRAIRSPARDAMLSHAASRTGLGWGFGLHEALDQIGAVTGPLVLAVVLSVGRGYQRAYALLLVPALCSIALLLTARAAVPRPRDLEVESSVPLAAGSGFSRQYWWYVAAASLVAAGFTDYQLIGYHFSKTVGLDPGWMPGLYALAMATDAIAALVLGAWFERAGIWVLIATTFLSALACPLVFLGGLREAIVGMAFWGIGMGAQESVMRAVVAGLTPPERRGTAFGTFNACFGSAWFAGSVLLGWLYDHSLLATVSFGVAAQLGAIPVWLWMARRTTAI